MWIERVTARAFGPFAGETLDLAPGLTVIVGPNESGKSTWHAAIRTAICGLRRGRGRGTAAEVLFEERHRPWDAQDRWEVEARLHLDHGRTIEISHDLAGKVACRATDVGLGRDVSAEIMDGTPDASRWLGLDRDAFAATVCVGQSQILTIANRDTAAALQEHMQRAAATRGTDATAAEARARIAVYRRDHVGLDRVGARGPLRAATTAVDAASLAMADARRQHGEYLEAEVATEEAQRAADAAARRIGAIEAAAARRLADATSRHVARAAELSGRYPQAPEAVVARAAHADQVVAAINAWTGRPRPAALRGPSSAELERELAALPSAPDGDRQVDATVAESRRRLDLVVEGLRLHAEDEPTVDGAAKAGPGSGALATGAVLVALAAGIGAFTMGQAALAATLVVIGVGIAGWSVLRARGVGREATLRIAHTPRQAWEARGAELAARHAAAVTALRGALAARGAVIGPQQDVAEAYAAYAEACRRQSEQALLAERAEGLRSALEARRVAEGGVEAALRTATRAEKSLRLTARAVGVDVVGAAPEQLLDALRTWQGEQAERMRRADLEAREWQELTGLLDGRTVPELRSEVEAREARANQLANRVPAAELQMLLGRDDLERMLAVEREELARLQRDADTRAGALEQMRRDLPDVAEAEEALAEAESELSRVTDLARVLDETLRLIGGAEERVHRDLAPMLADVVRRWLPVVSGRAYLDASVDPADLSVRVKEAASGRWRSALLLSEGTREQIYLLLRVAMARHLVTTGETAPLLLDEVTAQADRERAEQLLQVLKMLSAERQVILFSHDDEVAVWAERNLDTRRDRLLRLGSRAEVPVTAPA